MSSFAEIIRPAHRSRAFLYDALCVFAGSLFIAILAQISIPLGFTPVPFTLQSLAILLVGAFLGSKRGFFAVVAYLSEGFLGLPFFEGGSFGLVKLLGPTGGYFLGFALAAFLVGYLLEKGWRFNIIGSLTAYMLGTLAILTSGALWLSFYVGFEKSLQMGVYPFLVGDLAKILMASLLVPSIRLFSRK